MKTYQIEIAIDSSIDSITWVPRGTIKGRSKSAVLRRAWYSVFDAYFDGRVKTDDTVFHCKYTEMPVLRIVEIS